MAKFIIEVSDGYIRERADLDNIIEHAKGDVAQGMIELMAFQNIEKSIDDGKTEFVIRSNDFVDAEETPRKCFNALVAQIAATVLMKEAVEDKQVEKER